MNTCTVLPEKRPHASQQRACRSVYSCTAIVPGEYCKTQYIWASPGIDWYKLDLDLLYVRILYSRVLTSVTAQ